VLAEEYVGLEEVDDGVWAAHFGPPRLRHFDEHELKLYGVYAYRQTPPIA